MIYLQLILYSSIEGLEQFHKKILEPRVMNVRTMKTCTSTFENKCGLKFS